MKNTLRTDIICDKSIMTKEEAKAYDSFIEFMAELCRESVAKKQQGQSREEVKRE